MESGRGIYEVAISYIQLPFKELFNAHHLGDICMKWGGGGGGGAQECIASTLHGDKG